VQKQEQAWRARSMSSYAGPWASVGEAGSMVPTQLKITKRENLLVPYMKGWCGIGI
jgi:hypothetical protein